MNEDPDIRRAALYLIKKHGTASAASIAGSRVRELGGLSQVNAAKIWQQIAEAIVELSKPDEG